jgi:cell division initiation protein
MITPLEIENKEFAKSLRGYNQEEVDEFLDRIILDLQQILDENARLKEEIHELKSDVEQHKKSEVTMVSTLESAKKLMNDISESAEKRAEIIIRNAEMDADVLRRDAAESVSRMTEEGEKLKEKVTGFRARYRQLLEDELNRLEGSSEELFADLEREFVPASMDEKAKDQAQPLTENRAAENPADVVKSPTMIRDKEELHFAEQQKGSRRDTIVLGEQSLEELLKSDYGVDPGEDSAVQSAGEADLTKTRIVK